MNNLETGNFEKEDRIDDVGNQVDAESEKKSIHEITKKRSVGFLPKMAEEPFSAFVIAIVTAVIVFVEKVIIGHLLHHPMSHDWAIAGTFIVLAGTCWATLGTHLSKTDEAKLDAMARNNALDVAEIVRMYKAASNFSTTGTMWILAGSLLLVVDIIFD